MAFGYGNKWKKMTICELSAGSGDPLLKELTDLDGTA